MTELTGDLIGKLEALLAEGFAAEGEGLEAKLRKLGGELPDDLRESLGQLAKESADLDGEAVIPFAFRCGQIHERLETLAQNRLAAHIAFLGPDGTPPPLELEKNDLDAIARFVKWRDQFIKTVADYTLKFLLVSVILLVLGLSLGLI